MDCEISFGAVTSEGFLITAPALPYRVGDLLSQHLLKDTLTTMDRDANGSACMRSWEIIQLEGEFGALQ